MLMGQHVFYSTSFCLTCIFGHLRLGGVDTSDGFRAFDVFAADDVIILYTTTYFFMANIPLILYQKYLLMEKLPNLLF